MPFLAFYVMMGASAASITTDQACEHGAQGSQEASLHPSGSNQAAARETQVDDDRLAHSFAQLEKSGEAVPFPRKIAKELGVAYAKSGDDSVDLGLAILKYTTAIGLGEEAVAVKTYAMDADILDEAKTKSASGLVAIISVIENYLDDRQGGDGAWLAPLGRQIKIGAKIDAILAKNPNQATSVVDNWGTKGKYPLNAVYDMLLRRVFVDCPRCEYANDAQDVPLKALERASIRNAITADLISRGWREIEEKEYPSFHRMLTDAVAIKEQHGMGGPKASQAVRGA